MSVRPVQQGSTRCVQTWRGPSVLANPTAPNFRMLLELAAPAGLSAAVQMDLSAPLLDTADEVLDALEALRDDLVRRPGYLIVRGRPVVFFVRQDQLSLASWEALRGGVDPGRQMIWVAEGASPEALLVFDGLYLMGPDRSALPGSAPSQAASQVRQWEQANGVLRYWVATTFPGYDDRLVVDAVDAYVLARRGGVTYRDNWALADASDPDWILVRSFNEWDRCTHIERSTTFGDSYLGLTAELVRQYRFPSTSATATPPALEPSATPTVQEPSSPEAPTPVATETAEPSATPEITPTVTPAPTATPFRLATPTASVVLPVDQPAIVTRPAAVTPEIARSAPAGVVATATPPPRSRPVVQGTERRSCTVLPLLLTTVCCWGAWLRNDRGTGR